VAVVTGAGSGIGRAIALRFAELGGTPILVGRNRARLATALRRVGELAPAASTWRLDLRSAEETEQSARELLDRLDRLDLLVHSASTWFSSSLEDMPVGWLDEQYAVGVRGPVQLTRILLPRLVASAGQIVFVNSSAVQGAAKGLLAYGAMKRALSGVADHLRAELNERGVRVLSVFPGRTATPMQRRVHAREGRHWTPARLIQPDDVASIVLHASTLPRTAEVTEIHIRPMLPPGTKSRKARRAT